MYHAKSWLTGKDSDAGRDWGQEEKGTTEDETAGWHHRLNGHEFEWTLGVGDGQGGPECCDLRGRKESDRTEQLNWTDLRTKSVWMIQQMWYHYWSSFLFPKTKTDKNILVWERGLQMGQIKAFWLTMLASKQKKILSSLN